jgi:hypothetical protein
VKMFGEVMIRRISEKYSFQIEVQLPKSIYSK